MLGTIFGLMLLLLVLTVPIGVVLLCVSLFPVLIDHNFIASETHSKTTPIGVVLSPVSRLFYEI